MKHNKFVWVTLIQLIWLKETRPSNSTQTVPTQGSPFEITDIVTNTSGNSSDVTGKPNESSYRSELLEIFHSNITENVTTAKNVDETSTVDHLSAVLSWNDTVKTNYTIMSEAVASHEEQSPFRLESAGAIAAGVFLVSAVVGYFSCVGYRRFMQKKYGNSQIVAGEDVYDTSDLRYFEI